MVNKDVSVPIMIFLNKYYADKYDISAIKIDFEESMKDITNFVIDADSASTPLLTHLEPGRANNSNKNNIALSGYVGIYNH